ncbi:GtrA family protein [Mesobacillus harenae]|uniref:GtrA family protein n=1 Tax=Mesobacillus harenae TaxID=2213203 RepID=UPI00157FDEFF|nr:GtrA family protein [Mesobacillus harenae]
MKPSLSIFKDKQIINYLIFGVLTTLVNFTVFIASFKLLNINYQTSTVIAWFLAVLFAFITNKLFVFNSRSFSLQSLSREFLTFSAFRILSLGIDLSIMFIMIDLLTAGEIFSKITANVIIVFFNYTASKSYIFKNENAAS